MLFGRLSIKSLVAIGIISVLCVIIMSVIFYNQGPQMIVTQAQNEAMRTARIAAGDIDGDVFEKIKTEDSPEFNAVYDTLSKYKDGETISYIYSMKKVSHSKVVFVVDTDEEEPAELFEPYESLEGMDPAFNGKVSADADFTYDEWGTFISGYAPIYNSKNRVVGIVGCDIKEGTVDEWLMRLRFIIIVLAIIPNAIMVLMLGGVRAQKENRRQSRIV